MHLVSINNVFLILRKLYFLALEFCSFYFEMNYSVFVHDFESSYHSVCCVFALQLQRCDVGLSDTELLTSRRVTVSYWIYMSCCDVHHSCSCLSQFDGD